MKKFRGVFIKNEKEIALLREANRMVSLILDALEKEVHPGVSTMHCENLARRMCAEFGVAPAFLNYNGYPYALCCALNEIVVHGFPSDVPLKEGDIISFDMGVIYHGFYGDSARTFAVGSVSPVAEALMRVTRESLYQGIAAAKPGNDVYAIGAAVQNHVEAAGFNVVRRFVGHGVGSCLHEKPEVPNFSPKMLPGVPLKAGMVLAIEPMVTEGTWEVDILDDQWTAVTRDRKLAAHFEHTVVITPEGAEILSLSN